MLFFFLIEVLKLICCTPIIQDILYVLRQSTLYLLASYGSPGRQKVIVNKKSLSNGKTSINSFLPQLPIHCISYCLGNCYPPHLIPPSLVCIILYHHTQPYLLILLVIIYWIAVHTGEMYNKFQGKSWSVNYCVKNEHNFPIFFFLFGNIFFKTTYIACKVFFRGRRFSSKCFRYHKITKNKINKDKFCVFIGPHCFCFIGQVCLGKVASGHTIKFRK